MTLPASPVVLAAPPDRPRRVVYLGTPEVAVAPLRALVAAGVDVALVVTRPDTRRGRGASFSPSPVKAAALDLGLPVDHDLGRVCDVGADLGVVVAYGRLVPVAVLARLAMVNLHFSLLPRWRGAAPVERALLAGDTETGVCLMEVAEGLDTGGVHASVTTPIRADDTLDSLRGRLVDLGTELLIGRLAAGLGPAIAQHGEPTYAAKIDPAELAIDWDRPASYLDRLVRLGGAHTTWKGARLKVWAARVLDAATEGSPGTVVGGVGRADQGLLVATGGPEVLEVLEVQPEGRGRQRVADWRNGARPAVGERFGS